MNGNWMGVCALSVLLAGAGCRQNVRPQAVAAEPVAVAPKFTTVTLSAEQLMSLDWAGRAAGRAAVLDKRLAGAGVEFDIRFPGNAVGVCSMDYVSTGSAGRGTLAGLDASGYQAFALKFTLVAVNGHSDPNVPLELAAGAVIGPAGDGKPSSCEPVVLGFAPDRTTQIAKTPMRAGKIRVIGIHAHVANPKIWDISGGVVTLRVEPAADAEVLPSPVLAAAPTSGGKTAKPAPAASRGTSTKPQPGKSPKPRTKSPSSPSLGTTHIGAW